MSQTGALLWQVCPGSHRGLQAPRLQKLPGPQSESGSAKGRATLTDAFAVGAIAKSLAVALAVPVGVVQIRDIEIAVGAVRLAGAIRIGATAAERKLACAGIHHQTSSLGSGVVGAIRISHAPNRWIGADPGRAAGRVTHRCLPQGDTVGVVPASDADAAQAAKGKASTGRWVMGTVVVGHAQGRADWHRIGSNVADPAVPVAVVAIAARWGTWGERHTDPQEVAGRTDLSRRAVGVQETAAISGSPDWKIAARALCPGDSSHCWSAEHCSHRPVSALQIGVPSWPSGQKAQGGARGDVQGIPQKPFD